MINIKQCSCVSVDDAEEDDEMLAKSRKPWGDTSFYCPIAFKNQGVLWPGNLDISARYKDRHYTFSTDEAKERFIENPNLHVADDTPLKVQDPFTIILYIYMYNVHCTLYMYMYNVHLQCMYMYNVRVHMYCTVL